MARPRILLIDPDYDTVWRNQAALCEGGYDVLMACDGRSGLKLARSAAPQVIVLDLELPDVGGLELCRELRRLNAHSALSILILTDRSTLDDCVAGLDAGADDYMAKPCVQAELQARIRALLRRQPGFAPPTAGITLLAHQRRVVIGERQAELTKLEYQVLQYLVERAGTLVSAEQLLHDVWGYWHPHETTATVRWHVRQLRKKLETDPQHPAIIRTVRSGGYAFFAPEARIR
ncbi:MAG TPA: response regulator transcription factor [Roseiflexaceae bacterium]|jgi:DNA-binding response OmpR family regulator|nr:response regulator transcription factor [Roseiflexaceae bacterium]